MVMRSVSGELAEPILVGREEEIKELQTCLDLMIGGQGITVFLSGEAGTGKTRLVKEFLHLLDTDKVLILSGWCLSNAVDPYFPFIESFDSCSTEKSEQHEIVSGQLR